MKRSIKSIDTIYNGYKFRSRLEARWAIFFDSVGIKYRYEPEGYITSHGWYLPDFYIDSMNLFIDVKGNSKAEPLALNKLSEICKKNQRGAILENIPLVKNDVVDPLDPFNSEDFALHQNTTFGNGEEDGLYLFCKCTICGQMGFEFEGRSARIDCGCDHGECGNGDKSYNYDDHAILDAYKEARMARFEHDDKKWISIKKVQ